MSQRKLDQQQIDYILVNHQEQTAEQLAVKVKCALWVIYDVCRQHNIKPLKPKDFKRSLKTPPSLIGSRQQSKRLTIDQISADLKRPPALYTNTPSPYGIATKLHQGEIF